MSFTAFQVGGGIPAKVGSTVSLAQQSARICSTAPNERRETPMSSTAFFGTRRVSHQFSAESVTQFSSLAKVEKSWSLSGLKMQLEEDDDLVQVGDSSFDAIDDLPDILEGLDIAALGARKAAPEPAKPREREVDAFGRAYGTGRRKESSARVWVKEGTGEIVINYKPLSDPFGKLYLLEPFELTELAGKMDVMATVKGGGISGQLGAIRLGISRALQNFDPELRPNLKKAGMLRRDPRAVERKKAGLKKARKAPQWAKR